MRAMSRPQTISGDTAALVPWQQSLIHSSNRSQVMGLIESPNAAILIQNLGVLEVYQAVKALGPESAAPVLALMSTEQTRALLDLDVWHEHAFDISDVLLWLTAFRAGGLDCLHKAARALDQEALSLLFRRRLLIVLTPKDDASDQAPLPDWAVEPPEDLSPLVTTPDGRFIIAARLMDEWNEPDGPPIDEEERKAILQLVHELYLEEDWAYVSDMLRGAESDLSSSLEEDALKFRDARLEDLGFPPLARALEIYGPLDPKVLQDEQTGDYPALDQRLPAAYAQPLAQGLFHEAMSGVPDLATVRRIEADLMPMANSALVADGAEPGHVEHLQDTLTRARGYIELALAHETPAGPQRLETAVHRLQVHHLSVLFRVGYTLTVRAARRARALAARSALEQEGLPLARLEEAERVVLDALRAKRPRVSRALDPWVDRLKHGQAPVPLDAAQADEQRPFCQPEDLDAVHGLLNDLEALADAMDARAAQLAAACKAPATVPAEERTAQLFINTAAAHTLLGRAPSLEALAVEDLPGLVEALADPKAAIADTVAAWFGAGEPAVKARVMAGWLALQQSVAGVDPEAVDPRFIEGLLVEAGTR